MSLFAFCALVTAGIYFVYDSENGLVPERLKRAASGMVALGSVICHIGTVRYFGYGDRYFIYVSLGILLVVMAVVDLLTFSIPVKLLALSLGVAVWGVIIMDIESWLYRVLMASVAVVVVLIAGRVFGNAVGEGDSCVLGIAILGLGWQYALTVFLAALILAAITGMVLMIVKKKSGKTIMPFMPFIAAVHIMLPYMMG